MKTNIQGTSMEVTAIDADWDWGVKGNSVELAPKLCSITFIPGSANDVLVVKDGSDAGPIIFQTICLDAIERTQYYFGARKRIYIDHSDCTLSFGHKVLICLWPNRR